MKNKKFDQNTLLEICYWVLNYFELNEKNTPIQSNK